MQSCPRSDQVTAKTCILLCISMTGRQIKTDTCPIISDTRTVRIRVCDTLSFIFPTLCHLQLHAGNSRFRPFRGRAQLHGCLIPAIIMSP